MAMALLGSHPIVMFCPIDPAFDRSLSNAPAAHTLVMIEQ
jgi:hypothetical protein